MGGLMTALVVRAALVCALLGCEETSPPVDEVSREFRCQTALDVPAACGDCLAASCCDEVIACGEDLRCKPCVQPGLGAVCAAPGFTEAWAAIDCMKEHCATVCPPPFIDVLAEAACEDPPAEPDATCVPELGWPGFKCNPITNDGCEPGEACDRGGSEYMCFPSESSMRGPCELCGYSALDGCQAGLSCVGKCARYCCTSADCGSGGFCDPRPLENGFLGNPPAPEAGLGLCVVAP
jgi:hypothetical protein